MFDTSPQLDCAGRILRLDRARVMGIVNVTPIRSPMVARTTPPRLRSRMD